MKEETIYAKYGRVFRQLRIQKRLTLESFEKAGVSKGTLSKFEHGKSMLGFEKLLLALNNLSVSLEEYERCLNNFQRDAQEQLIWDVRKALVSEKEEAMAICYEEAMLLGEKHFALAIKSCRKKLKFSEVDDLADYFESLVIWRRCDLFTLYLVLEYFELSEILHQVEAFLLSNNLFAEALSYSNFFFFIGYKGISIMIYEGKKEISKHLFNLIDSYPLQHDMYTRNLRNLTSGYWELHFGDKVRGAEKVKEALRRFSELGEPELAEYYKRLYHIRSCI